MPLLEAHESLLVMRSGDASRSASASDSGGADMRKGGDASGDSSEKFLGSAERRRLGDE